MFNFTFFLISSTILLLLLTTYTDIKQRIIPNLYLFYFFVLGFIFQIVYAIYNKSISLFFMFLLILILNTIIFYIFYNIGIFAGGDFKLFITLVCLCPLPLLKSASFLITLSYPLQLFFLSLFCSIPYLLLLCFYELFSKNYYKIFINSFFKKSNLISILQTIFLLFLVTFILHVFFTTTSLYLTILLSFLFMLFFSKLKLLGAKYFYILTLLLYSVCFFFLFLNNLHISLFFNNLLSITFFTIVWSALLSLYYIIKTNILVYKKDICQLKEGDVPFYNYYYHNKKLILKKHTFFQYLKFTLNSTYHKNLKINSKHIGGLTHQDIMFLNTMYENNVIDKYILLKRTIAFVPQVLLAYLIYIYLVITFV